MSGTEKQFQKTAIPINGDYVWDYVTKYAFSHNMKVKELTEEMGRSETYIGSSCNYGAMDKASLKALCILTGMNETLATSNPHKKRSEFEIRQEKTNDKSNNMDEIKKYYESLVNKIQWGNSRIERFPQHGHSLERIEAKLDFLISELASQEQLEQLEKKFKSNPTVYGYPRYRHGD